MRNFVYNYIMINLLDYSIEEKLNSVFKKLDNQEVVIFCVGNYKVWYDSFGPLLASKLREIKTNCFIYGGVENMVVSENLLEYMNFIENKHPLAKVIIIDNCLAIDESENLELVIKKRNTIPGGLISSKAFGDISIILKVDTAFSPEKYLFKQNIIIKTLSEKLKVYIDKVQKNANNNPFFCKLCLNLTNN